MEKGKVLQDWMGKLPWKQQSVILSSLRGPDNFRFPAIKKLIDGLEKLLKMMLIL